MTQPGFPPVPGGFPFPQLERETLAQWRSRRIFERTLEATRDGEPYVFFEGPPTANNTPHVGHVLTRVVKDLFPRFQTMRGRHVRRKAGWDTHGLAVEIEVEKRLGLSGKKDIEQLVPGDRAASIAKFNAACLESVMTYERQWRAMTERFGYWIDLDDAYFTYSNGYVESVWSAIRRLHDLGLLYEGHKSQPYCARCGTTLSSHEVAQNYKEVDDPSIWVLFPVRPGQRLASADGGEWTTPDGLHLVAWTTTPWTMPGHAGMSAHPDLVYRVVEHPERAGVLVLFADAIELPIPVDVVRDGKAVRLDLRDQPALARFRGVALEGLRYDRPYRTDPADSPAEAKRLAAPASDEHGWPVVLADYVTATDGTGLVHTAPAFGADDHQTGLKYGLPLFRTIEPTGRVAERAGLERLSGLWFKDADKEVVRDLKERGLLLHTERFKHSYPFCWRCDTPLLQYATESWFVRTTAIRDRLVERNREIGWHPETIGTGRFGNWLEGVVDWALSRRRYWGTPLPIWKCDGCPQTFVAGSFEELFAEAGRPQPADLHDRAGFDPHRPSIDEITWPCYACNGGVFRRVEDVLDAWFDSGSMPFAQDHRLVHEQASSSRWLAPENFRPADFISEAVDQTRGWFYTLHVLAVALFDSVAFRNCIVLGHVNDEQGRKMSKRLGNVVDPMTVVEETGADALRWYFYVTDPEQPSRFSARLVREAAQGFLLPIWNALSFFTIYANLDGWRPGKAKDVLLKERTDLDRWILLQLDELVETVTRNLESYTVAPAARAIEAFLDDLTNWYIRRSRDRFWANSESGSSDKEAGYQTLYEVLTTLARLVAPFTPFVAESLHERLVRSQLVECSDSIHLEPFPTARGWLDQFDEIGRNEALRLVQAMSLAKRVVGLARAARSTHDLKTRQPLSSMVLVFAQEIFGVGVKDHLERVKGLILDEVNVKEIRWAERRGEFVTHEVRPNFRVVGKKLGAKMKAVQASLAAADGDELAAALERDGRIELTIDGSSLRLAPEDLEVRLLEKEGLATAGDRELLVVLDTRLTPELVAEGRAREVVNRIQTARKEAGLDYADRIRVRYRAAGELEAAIAAWRDWIAGETLAVELSAAAGDDLRAAPVDDLEFAFAVDRAG
ncbi:MAG: isoleucine--tRNA ligase [Thermoanaerobaculia bacterium]|nr:MAG: isoleucine--tRNA ligase [Thermoanaerobaculia bacterium]